MSDTFLPVNIPLNGGYIYETPQEMANPSQWKDVSSFRAKDNCAEEIRQPAVITTTVNYSANTQTGQTIGKLGFLASPEQGAANRQNVVAIGQYGIFHSIDGGITLEDVTPNPAEATTGTAGVTQNSPTVTTAGATLTKDFQGGKFTKAGSNVWYTISSINTATNVITLSSNYLAATEAAVTFRLTPALAKAIDSSAIPKISQDSFYFEADKKNYSLITDWNGTLWYAPGGTSTLYARIADIAGATGVPKARIVRSFKNFLVAAGTDTLVFGGLTPASPMKLMWTAVNTIKDWTTAATGAGNTTLNQGGSEILGMEKLGDYLMVYTDAGVYRGQYVALPNIFVFSKISEVGLFGFGTISKGRNIHFIIGKDGFYINDGASVKPIKTDVDEYFFDKLFRDNAGFFNCGCLLRESAGEAIVYYYKNAFIFNAAVVINLKNGAVGIYDASSATSANMIEFTEEITGYGDVVYTAESSNYVVLFDPPYQVSVPVARTHQAYIQTIPIHAGMLFGEKSGLGDETVVHLGRVELDITTLVNSSNSTHKLILTVFRGDEPGNLTAEASTTLTITGAGSTKITPIRVRQDYNLSYKYFSFKIATYVTNDASYNANGIVRLSQIRVYVKPRGRI